jgi:hypothetical protein
MEHGVKRDEREGRSGETRIEEVRGQRSEVGSQKSEGKG